MMPVLLALWQASYSVHRARKLWIAARRAGHDIGRDQVARLMGLLDIRSAKRQKRARAAVADPTAARPGDLVERDFAAAGPNRLRVADLTQAATWSGVAYVCFITAAFPRRIVSGRAGPNKATRMVLDASETARRNRDARLEGFVVRTDAAIQITGIRYSERIDDIGATPSIGPVGDSCDNTLDDPADLARKLERVRAHHNRARLHQGMGYVAPDDEHQG